jgi:hypothetical protein
MPPFLIPLLAGIAIALGLFGKRGGAALLDTLADPNRDRGSSSGTKTEIHNHYYGTPKHRAVEDDIGRPSEAPEPTRRRRARRDPPRVLDLNPYDDEQEIEQPAEIENEAKP